MRKIILPALVAFGLSASLLPADAAGCLKGAAVGGVAGHVAGGHGVLGAAAGCAIGHHEAAKQAKTQAAANRTAQSHNGNGDQPETNSTAR